MIVYGDASVRTSVREVLAYLSALPSDSVEDLRERVIIAGQLEQGLEDDFASSESVRYTNCCARAFVAGYLGRDEKVDLSVPTLPDRIISLRVPEGYQSYALYPEQYIESAKRVVTEEPTLVVGIRSIGTSLAAVVAQTLALHGHPVARLTVRPTGDPYDRLVDEEAFRGYERYQTVVVVDEGPGRSGSSFAAVATALVRKGWTAEGITFLTSHGGQPGSEASEEVRAIWAVVRRETSDYAARVREQIRERGGESAQTCSFERGPVYQLFEHPMERTGDTLWIFYGLPSFRSGCKEAIARFAELGRFALLPAGEPLLGWVPLRLEEARPALPTPEELLSYLKLGLREVREPVEALARLAYMAYWNTHKSLGGEAAERMKGLTPPEPPAGPGYVDGRMMAGNWQRRADGTILKLDPAGHQSDNTIIGEQSIAWDLAGAEVELCIPLWAEFGLESFRDFYLAAYHAFWLGMARMCAEALPAGDPNRAALEADYGRYVEGLRRLLT